MLQENKQIVVRKQREAKALANEINDHKHQIDTQQQEIEHIQTYFAAQTIDDTPVVEERTFHLLQTVKVCAYFVVIGK